MSVGANAALKFNPAKTPAKERRPLLTPKEVARLLGLDKVIADERKAALAVRQMCRRGQLRAVRVSKYTMVHPDSVDAYLGESPS